MKICLFFLILINLVGCHKDGERWKNPLEQEEITILCTAIDKIDAIEIEIYTKKIASLSNESLIFSSWNDVQNLKPYKEIYNWIKNEVKNYPLLFHYVIYEQKITGEEQSNSVGLLWDLARELHPAVVEEMASNDNFCTIYLIKQLLPLYSED